MPVYIQIENIRHSYARYCKFHIASLLWVALGVLELNNALFGLMSPATMSKVRDAFKIIPIGGNI